MTKSLDFILRFLAMAQLKQASLCSFGLTKTFICAAALMLAGFTQNAIAQVPPLAERDAPTQRLLDYLYENQGKKMLTGTMACVDYNFREAEWVYKHTGTYPAINCIDYIHDNISKPGNWIDYSDVVPMMKWTQGGGVMSAMWHWGMPTNDGTSTTCTPGTADDKTGFRPSAILDPESEGYARMMSDIDRVAEWMKPLGKRGIPILWRPLHEAQGNWREEYSRPDGSAADGWHTAWMWWGIDGPEVFKALWHAMYDRMVNYHGLHNLIWVFTTGNSTQWYPGDDYVDVIGSDSYGVKLKDLKAYYKEFQTNFPGKLYAITEWSSLPSVKEQWEAGCYWSFFIPWYDYDRTSNSSSEKYNSTEHVNCNIEAWKAAFECDFIVSRDEMTDIIYYDGMPRFQNGATYQFVNKCGMALAQSGSKLALARPNESDKKQQWTVSRQEDGNFTMQNAGSSRYVYLGTSNSWDAAFAANLPAELPRAEFNLVDLGDDEGSIGITLIYNGKYLGTDATTNGSTVYLDKRPSSNGKWEVKLIAEPVGIEPVHQAQGTWSNEVYDLAGRRVGGGTTLPRGIYIRNGKNTVIR